MLQYEKEYHLLVTESTTQPKSYFFHARNSQIRPVMPGPFILLHAILNICAWRTIRFQAFVKYAWKLKLDCILVINFADLSIVNGRLPPHSFQPNFEIELFFAQIPFISSKHESVSKVFLGVFVV